ncbi:MAG: protein-L-isoaspartate O-methyltransferase [Deltaproteobacteria bacterium]|nr:protein-L-isoaspartate O-methyltransferase [Deltaproteobacteria bacterium]
MVEQQLSDIADARVLQAMAEVPRHSFVDEVLRPRAYDDGPLPIGKKQTISQPWIVARMTELLCLEGDETVLEVGTGSGYQAAVLSSLCRRVVTLERHGDLARDAGRRIEALGMRNITVLASDGSLGRSEYGPYDAILVTAAAPEVPEPLLNQLASGGRLVVPLGDLHSQVLHRFTRDGDSYSLRDEAFEACRFVPLLGRLGFQEER